jgi:hypothetical protein
MKFNFLRRHLLTKFDQNPSCGFGGKSMVTETHGTYMLSFLNIVHKIHTVLETAVFYMTGVPIPVLGKIFLLSKSRPVLGLAQSPILGCETVGA